MNLTRALTLTALCALFLLPPGLAQESAAPEQPELSHPVLVHWHEVLMSQSEPELLLHCTLKDGEKLSEEEQRDFDEAREHIATALDAAESLFRARMDIIEHAMSVPGSRYFQEGDEDEWTEEAEEVYTTCEQWVAEGFRRDLEALSFSMSWLDAGSVTPALRPGRQELLFRPERDSLAFAQVDGNTSDIAAGYASLNQDWQQQQDLFMKRLISLYGDGELAASDPELCEPFTGMSWQREEDHEMTRETLLFRARMRELIRWEQQVWEIYLKAMEELVSPCSGYRGSGTGSFIEEYKSHLLDSRERFLCLLTVGCRNLHKLSELTTERSAALLELHTRHRFGEIFTCDTQIFRHPKLEGNPWCIRFHRQGAGFIFIHENEELQRYAASHPQGGETEVRGYQAIEQVGAPFERVEEKDRYGDEEPFHRPEGGLEPRQVFHILSITPERE